MIWNVEGSLNVEFTCTDSVLFCMILFCLILLQLESLPKEDLIKYVKKQLALLKQTKGKCEGTMLIIINNIKI